MKHILPKEFEFICNKHVCFAPDEIFAVTDINKTGNMCITFRRVRLTIFAVEEQ